MKRKIMSCIAIAVVFFFYMGMVSAFATEIVNINTADTDTLQTLKGIGPKTADSIIKYRKKVGGFKNIEDIMEIKGIGEKIFAAIKPFIKVK